MTPDVLTTAKALGCGFPIGAMLTTDKIAASLVPGTHGSTFGGNPLACAVAEVAVDILSSPQVLSGVEQKSEQLVSALTAMGKKYDVFKEVRASGLLIGCELKEKYHGKAKDFVNAGYTHGVMMHVAGGDVLRLLPSLIITDEELSQGLSRIELAIADMAES